MRFHYLEAMPYAPTGRHLRKGRAISPVVAGTRTNSHLVTECFRSEGEGASTMVGISKSQWFTTIFLLKQPFGGYHGGIPVSIRQSKVRCWYGLQGPHTRWCLFSNGIRKYELGRSSWNSCEGDVHHEFWMRSGIMNMWHSTPSKWASKQRVYLSLNSELMSHQTLFCWVLAGFEHIFWVSGEWALRWFSLMLKSCHDLWAIFEPWSQHGAVLFFLLAVGVFCG